MSEPIQAGSNVRLTYFWTRVSSDGDCWEWLGHRRKTLYGSVPLGGIHGKTVQEYAHRFSWILANQKPIPRGRVICHTCDNPVCVRPDHLYLGTPADNVRDRCARGRTSRKTLTSYAACGHPIVRAPTGQWKKCPTCAASRRKDKEPRPNIDTVQLRRLPARTADVLRRWCGFECEAQSLTEISRDYGVSRQRVQQLRDRALAIIQDTTHRTN